MKNSSAYALPNPNRMNTQGILRVQTPAAVAALANCGSIVRSFAVGAFKLSGSVALSAAAATLTGALCGGIVDLVNEPVTAAFGQLDCVIISMALWFMIIPASFGLIFGGCKGVLRGSHAWYLIPALVVFFLGAGDIMLERDVFALVEVAPWLGIAGVLAYLGMISGQILFEEKKVSD